MVGPWKRVFAQKRLRAETKHAKVVKRRRAAMPSVTAMDESAGVASPVKQIIHHAAQQAGAGGEDHFFK